MKTMIICVIICLLASLICIANVRNILEPTESKEAKENLLQIYDLQVEYHEKTKVYSADLMEIGFQAETEAKDNLSSLYAAQQKYFGENKVYASKLSDLDFQVTAGAGNKINYEYIILETYEDGFKADAIGKGDRSGDRWSIDKDNIPKHEGSIIIEYENYKYEVTQVEVEPDKFTIVAMGIGNVQGDKWDIGEDKKLRHLALPVSSKRGAGLAEGAISIFAMIGSIVLVVLLHKVRDVHLLDRRKQTCIKCGHKILIRDTWQCPNCKKEYEGSYWKPRCTTCKDIKPPTTIKCPECKTENPRPKTSSVLALVGSLVILFFIMLIPYLIIRPYNPTLNAEILKNVDNLAFFVQTWWLAIVCYFISFPIIYHMATEKFVEKVKPQLLGNLDGY